MEPTDTRDLIVYLVAQQKQVLDACQLQMELREKQWAEERQTLLREIAAALQRDGQTGVKETMDGDDGPRQKRSPRTVPMPPPQDAE